MAARNLARLQFQNEHDAAGAASGANTYTLDAISNGIILKVEASVNSATVVVKVRWLSSDSLAVQLIQTLTFTAVNDGTGVTKGSYYHTTAPSNLAALDGYGLKVCKVDIVSVSSGSASVWLAGK
jgi:hypothetical protein